MKLLIIIFVAAFIFGWITWEPSNSRPQKKKTLEEATDALEECLKSIKEAQSVSLFIKSWKDAETLTKELGSYRKKLQFKKKAREALDEVLNSVGTLFNDENFQWMLRDAIERMKKNCVRAMKTTYKNSKQHKHRIFVAFCEELKQNRELFSDETREFADEMLGEVTRISGETVNPQSSDRAKASLPQQCRLSVTLADIDRMDGHEFEAWCASLLKANKYENVVVTQGSGDQGVDVLAEKDGIRFAIQCKCYTKDLGNTPIQEVVAGKAFYNCHIGVVMTNRYFTKGAVDLANKTGILLWDRDTLSRMIENANA